MQQQIFNDRTLAKDYKNLIQILQPGITILDIGCGTGSISKDIAHNIGPNRKSYRNRQHSKLYQKRTGIFQSVANLELIAR